MIFAQFYVYSTGYIPGSIPPRFSDDNIRLIEKLGSDGVAIIDGRFGVRRQHETAREIGKKRGAKAYRLFAGASFSSARPLHQEPGLITLTV